MIYLCDLDGTVADCSHRLHFIQGTSRNYWAFFAACVDDKPIPEVIKTLQLLYKGGATIIVVSGRSDEVRFETTVWLNRYGVPWDELYMRKAGDHREDSIVKAELLTQIISDYTENEQTPEIVGVFDDRDQVVKMWRKKGLKVFQVAEGNF